MKKFYRQNYAQQLNPMLYWCSIKFSMKNRKLKCFNSVESIQDMWHKIKIDKFPYLTEVLE